MGGGCVLGVGGWGGGCGGGGGAAGSGASGWLLGLGMRRRGGRRRKEGSLSNSV